MLVPELLDGVLLADEPELLCPAANAHAIATTQPAPSSLFENLLLSFICCLETCDVIRDVSLPAKPKTLSNKMPNGQVPK